MLYHYTCSHGAKGITRRGFIRPMPQPVLGGLPLVWLTDMGEPDRQGLGLTSQILACDRMEFCYLCDLSEFIEPWRVWIGRQPFARQMDTFFALHDTTRLPDRWFVSTRPVYAIQDRNYSGIITSATVKP